MSRRITAFSEKDPTANTRGTTFSSDSENDLAPQPKSFWSSDEDDVPLSGYSYRLQTQQKSDAGEGASDGEGIRKKAQQSLLTGITTGSLELFLGKALRQQILLSGAQSRLEFTRQSDNLHVEFAEMRNRNRSLQNEVEESRAKYAILSSDCDDLAKEKGRLKDALHASQLKIKQLIHEVEHLRKEKQNVHDEVSQEGLKVESRFDSLVTEVKSEVEELKESRDKAVLKREEHELRMSYFEDNCCRLNEQVSTFQTEQMVAEEKWDGRHRQQEEVFQERHREIGLLNTRLESQCDELRAELAERLSIHVRELEARQKSEKCLENQLHVFQKENQSLQDGALDKAGLEVQNKRLQDLIAHHESEALLCTEEYREHEQSHKQDIELLSKERDRLQAALEEYKNMYNEQRSGINETQDLAKEGVFEDTQDLSFTQQHDHRSRKDFLDTAVSSLEGEYEGELRKKATEEVAEVLKQRQLLQEQVEDYRRAEAEVAEEAQQPRKHPLNGRGALQLNSPRERKRLAGLAQSNAAAVAMLLRQVRSTEVVGGLEDGVFMGGSQLRAVHALEQQTDQLGHTNHQWASSLAGRSHSSLQGGSGWTRGAADDDTSKISCEHLPSDSAAFWGSTVTDLASPLAPPGPGINSALSRLPVS